MLQCLLDRGAGFGLGTIEHLGPGDQLALEPAEGLAAELGPRGLIGRRIILALTAAGQRGIAGGVVAVLGLAVVGQLGVGLERVGGEPGRGGVELAGVADLGEGEPFGGVGGRSSPLSTAGSRASSAASRSASRSHCAEG